MARLSPDPLARTLSLALLALLALPPLSTPIAASGSDTGYAHAIARLPSISAQQVTLHRASGTELSRVRLELSPAGMRVRQQGAGAALEIVQDFVGERIWFVDRERAIAHEVPLEADPTSAADVPESGFGLTASAPCAEREGQLDRTGRWRGQAVEIWHCTDADGVTGSVEVFSLDWRLVVRVGTPDGRVEELRDIRARVFDAAHFAPAARLRAVDKGEFFVGVPELGRFEETTASAPPSGRAAR